MSDQSNQDFIFDKRLTERHIQAGAFDRQQLDKHLAELEDLTGSCDNIMAMFVGEDSVDSGQVEAPTAADNEADTRGDGEGVAGDDEVPTGENGPVLTPTPEG